MAAITGLIVFILLSMLVILLSKATTATTREASMMATMIVHSPSMQRGRKEMRNGVRYNGRLPLASALKRIDLD